MSINSDIDCTALKTSIGTVAKSLSVLEISNLDCHTNVIPVGELRNLKELNVSRSAFVNDEWLMTLTATCKLLTNLNISGWKNIILYIPYLYGYVLILFNLLIVDCRFVTNLGLSSVASLPKLLHLNVSHLDYTTDEELGNMPILATPKCRCCKMVW